MHAAGDRIEFQRDWSASRINITRIDLNDNVLHFPLIHDMAQAIERGRNPFDWWAREWSLGYPVLRTYQPLAHALVALIYFALFKTASLVTILVIMRLPGRHTRGQRQNRLRPVECVDLTLSSTHSTIW
jgi:hypothetical protein